MRTVPSNAELVWFDGSEYWCEDGYGTGVDRCVRTSSQVPERASFALPDVWCDFDSCTYYDPEDYVEVFFDGRNFICEQAGYSYSGQRDCAVYLGGAPPLILSPELYCSGSDWNLECSTYWYPDELDRYQLTTINGLDHLCEDAWQGGFGDLDCYRYSGGDPSFVGGTVDAYCSGSGSFIECSDEWYPNELERYDFTFINGVEYVCEDALFGSWGDQDCFRYYGGDPSQVTFGLPALYCSGDSFSMSCDSNDYPSAIEREWQNYSLISIGGSEYICDDGAFGDTPCVRYYGGGPSGYSFWSPDYYCDSWGGTCEPA